MSRGILEGARKVALAFAMRGIKPAIPVNRDRIHGTLSLRFA